MLDLLPSDARIAVERIARKLCPDTTTIDALANDRADYVSELTSVFFKAKDRFQIRCSDSEDEAGAYAFKSLWNHAAEVQRARSRRLSAVSWGWDPDTEVHPIDMEIQAQHREALAYVRGKLSPSQWELLAAYAEAGGSVAETHRGRDWGVGVGYLRQQVRQLQKKAQRLLVDGGFLSRSLDKESGLGHDQGMAKSRKELEGEADRLGVVWTYTTTDEELQGLINRRLGGMMDPGADAGMEPAHKCFGLYWDVPVEEACQTCDGRVPCLDKFAAETVPEKRAESPGLTREQLARELEVSEAALDEAIAHLATKVDAPAEVETEPEILEAEAAPAEDEDVQFEEDDDRAAGGESDEIDEEAEAEAPEQHGDPMGKSHLSLVPQEPVDELETEAMAVRKKKKASKKKASKKKVVVKKTASTEAPKRKKKAAKKKATRPPRGADTVGPAAVSAKKKVKRAKSAKSATAPAASKKLKCLEPDPWGKHTWMQRWTRERDRSPLVKKLKDGMVLKREYQGQTHQVKVLKRYYRYQGQEHPTLYSIVKLITGTQQAPRQKTKDGKRPEGHRQLCNWSAPKFFNLKALLGQ